MEYFESEVNCSQLPKVVELSRTLIENAECLKKWNEMAEAYHVAGRTSDSIDLLDTALNLKYLKCHNDFKKDSRHTKSLLGSYYDEAAQVEQCPNKKDVMLKQSRAYKNAAGETGTPDPYALLDQAFKSMRGGQIEQADFQLKLVLKALPTNVPAMLAKASIDYNAKNYKSALSLYQNVLRTCPKCPAHVRLSLGNCYAKLNNTEKARMAYERTLQLDPKNEDALVGIAILNLKSEGSRAVIESIEKVTETDSKDPEDVPVLNHLANHFFDQKLYEQAEKYAFKALHISANDVRRAETLYILGRIYHVQENYDAAHQYYYHASSLGSTQFVLPYFGLGQMYIQRGDIEKAQLCFEKVIEVEPQCVDTMRILASLYINSKCEDKINLALNYLKQVTKKFPTDVESWLQYAYLLEKDHAGYALCAYEMAKKLVIENPESGILPMILNNIAALEHRMKNEISAKDALMESIDIAGNDHNLGPQYKESIAVTTTYNLALVEETLFNTETAERLYKQILLSHPKYIDCYLRLGCMARNKGLIFVASDFFKDALKIDHNNPNARLLLGNLHSTKSQYDLARRHFTSVLKSPNNTQDPYAIIALGNLSLQALQQSGRNTKGDCLLRRNAVSCFKSVLEYDAGNIWAANGIGAVLAASGRWEQAESVFSLLRECNVRVVDVWLNMGHLHFQSRNYGSAINMYEMCLEKFNKIPNVEIMQYLAAAYFEAGRLTVAANILRKAFLVAPHEGKVIFNMAIVLEKIAATTIEAEHSNQEELETAIHYLNVAEDFFKFLATKGFNKETSDNEASRCHDLNLQAKYHLERARINFAEMQELLQNEGKQIEVQKKTLEDFDEIEERRLMILENESGLKETLERTKLFLKEKIDKVKRRKQSKKSKIFKLRHER